MVKDCECLASVSDPDFGKTPFGMGVRGSDRLGKLANFGFNSRQQDFVSGFKVSGTRFRVHSLCFLLPTETKCEGGTSQGKSETFVTSSNSGEFRDADRFRFGCRAAGFGLCLVSGL